MDLQESLISNSGFPTYSMYANRSVHTKYRECLLAFMLFLPWWVKSYSLDCIMKRSSHNIRISNQCGERIVKISSRSCTAVPLFRRLWGTGLPGLCYLCASHAAIVSNLSKHAEASFRVLHRSGPTKAATLLHGESTLQQGRAREPLQSPSDRNRSQ